MTDQKQKEFKTNKDKTYNKKRKPILRVEATTADTPEEIKEMELMKDELVEKSGTAKRGVINMYRFAKENGFFNKNT